MAAKTIFSYVFTISCSLCLIFHISSISKKYFAYDSNTLLELKQPETLTPPSFTYCVRYLDVSNITNHSTTIVAKADAATYYRNVTLNQIFSHTPPVDELFKFCTLAFPGNYSLKLFTANECMKVFRISRFYTQEYICYTVSLSIGGEYTFLRSVTSDVFSGIAYYLGFDWKHFNNTYVFKAVIHSPNGLPTTSIQFAPYVLRSTPVVHNHYVITSISVTKRLLPAPYLSDCLPDQPKYCYQRCLISESIAKWRHFPFTELITEENRYDYDFNLPHLTGYKMMDQSFFKQFVQLEQQCLRKCRHQMCEFEFSVTNLVASYVGWSEISFRIELPSSFSYFITLLPSMYLIDYITMVMSCFGTWLGVSAINFNPLQLWRWASHRNLSASRSPHTLRIIPRIHQLLNENRRATDRKINLLHNQMLIMNENIIKLHLHYRIEPERLA